MEIRIKTEAVEQRIAELKSKLPGIADRTEGRRARKQIRALQTKLKEMRGERVERKDYLKGILSDPEAVFTVGELADTSVKVADTIIAKMKGE